MLTPFDEMPSRQQLFLFQGLRITPNNNVIGGYAGIVVDGVQHAARSKRP